MACKGWSLLDCMMWEKSNFIRIFHISVALHWTLFYLYAVLNQSFYHWFLYDIGISDSYSFIMRRVHVALFPIDFVRGPYHDTVHYVQKHIMVRLQNTVKSLPPSTHHIQSAACKVLLSRQQWLPTERKRQREPGESGYLKTLYSCDDCQCRVAY